MKKFRKKILIICITLIFCPIFSNAAGGGEFVSRDAPGLWKPLIVCGYNEAVIPKCDFNALKLFAVNLINDLIILAFPIAAIAFVWAGFQMLTAGGDPGKFKKGREAMVKVAIGFAVIIGAYVIVSFIMNTFVNSENYINLLSR